MNVNKMISISEDLETKLSMLGLKQRAAFTQVVRAALDTALSHPTELSERIDIEVAADRQRRSKLASETMKRRHEKDQQ